MKNFSEMKTLLSLRDDFPIFLQTVRGKRLVYLDSAATTQKPYCVIAALKEFYETSNANVNRAVHFLSERASLQFENARLVVQKFLNAADTKECIFTRSTTDAINLVASSFGQAFIKAGDEVLVSMMEHHSNLVPWQLLCERTSAKLTFIPMNTAGDLVLDNLDELLARKPKILAISHISNALGTVHPIQTIIKQAHAYGVPVLVDAAQSAPHFSIDVQALDCDFLVFSGHKTYGPTGIGILYGKSQWLHKMPPYQGGGEMIKKVGLTGTIYNDLPYKFEAGTPPIAEAIALGCALGYLMSIGFEQIAAHEQKLCQIALSALQEIPDLQIIGSPNERSSIISFTLKGIHAHDIGTLVDQQGVALRTGHHCAMPIMDFYNIAASTRISFGLYNDVHDIAILMEALEYAKQVFGRKVSVFQTE